MSASTAKVHLALAFALVAASTGARADCGGSNTCCSEPGDSTYICRRVTVSSVIVTRGTFLRGPPGYQPGDVAISFSANSVLASNYCVVESGNILRLKRSDPNFDSRFALLLAAKVTGQVVDLVADPSPGSSCTLGYIAER